uniref:Delta(24)-sterol reductase n=1 Tax=Angiostrongylus cantonensis TaxID=6313 RepID=A0A0K0DNZ0_ANGCA
MKVREWVANGKGTIICPIENGRWRSHQLPKGITPIYIGNLVHILEVNKEELSVRVEPMVTMEDLSRTLIPLGYCVPLVPAMKCLTVQEAINGGGVGTSGRKYGMFQHICLSYELVMPDGNVVTASKEKNGDAEMQALYYSVPWSRGALGILVAVTLRMIRIKPFVKLMYIPVNSFEEMQSRVIKECLCRENEFVEGIQFSKSVGVVLRGKFSEGPPKSEKASINEISRWYKPCFYTHLQNIVSSNAEFAEFVPLQDFHNRQSRSLFWKIEVSHECHQSFWPLPGQLHSFQDLISFGKCFLPQWLIGLVIPSSIQLLDVC